MPNAANVSVISPVATAIASVKRLLFQPFDLGKWFVIGFCAWLAHLGEEGFHGGYNYNFGGHRDRQEFHHFKDYVVNNLYWIVPVAITVAVVGLALWVLCTWLSSRGRFMFLHCVALNKAEVRTPWQKFAREANSLFLFRIALGLVSLIAALPLAAFIGVAILRMADRGRPTVAGVLAVIATVLALIGTGILFFVIGKLTKDFVVPIMFLRGRKCVESWRELMGLLSANAGHFILYFLFQIVLAIVIGIGVFLVVIATCCIAGCLFAIPYLGTVFLLPILAFDRCYSLHYLAQYGGEYDVFPPLEPPHPGFTSPPPSSPAPV